MKKFALILLFAFGLSLLYSCGDNQQNKQAQEEVITMDSISDEMDKTTQELEQKTQEVEEKVDALLDDLE